MPERPHSHSCSQCGQIITDATSGKCQNCGHLFDQRQFREYRSELPTFKHKTTGNSHMEKPKQDDRKPAFAAPDKNTESICPQCRNIAKAMDIANRKCSFCGYIGLMTPKQVDAINQMPIEAPETPYSPAADINREQLQQQNEPVNQETPPVHDSSALQDAAPKYWKKIKKDAAPFNKFSAPKTTDKDGDWIGELENKFSFAPLLQGIKNFAGNIIILRIAATLIVAALIIFGIVKLVPVIFTSSSSTTSQQAASSGSGTSAEILEVYITDESITPSSVIIEWTTNKQATSKVQYGTDKNNLSGEHLDNNLTENHSITISNLESNTSYYYKIICLDSDGNEFLYEAEQPFTTKIPPDTTPPIISSVTVIPSKLTDVSAFISWEIDDEEADSFIEYGQADDYNTIIPSKDSSNIRTAVLGGLKPNTTYNFRVIAEDNVGNKSEPYIGTHFTTLAPVPTGYGEGDRAPDFNLEYFTTDTLPPEYIMSGNNVNLSDFRGKVVIVNFWSISCGACVAEMQEIQKIYDNSANDELIVLAIHTKQYRSRIERYFEEADWSLPVLLDLTGSTSYKYGITRIPMTFFIDSEGIIQNVKLGRFYNTDEIEDILERESLLGPRQ